MVLPCQPPKTSVGSHCLDFQIKMGLASMFYNTVGKRTSTFALAICVGAIGFERGFDRSERFLDGT